MSLPEMIEGCPLSEEDTGIDDFLQELSRSVLEQLGIKLASGELFRSSYESMDQVVAGYEYAIGMSEVRLELLPRRIDQWIWRDKGQYINSVLASCPKLAEGIDLIIRCLQGGSAGPDEDPALGDLVTQRAVDYISTFVLVLTDRLLEGGKEQEEGIIDITSSEFRRDLRGEQSGWDLKAFVKCFWLEEESCPLGEGIQLRRPRLEDYRDRRCVEGISWGGIRDLEVDMMGTSVGAIVEMRCPPMAEAAAREELNMILDTLVLFRVVSISQEHLDMHSRSVLREQEVKEEDQGKPPLFHAVLRAGDQADLQTFMNALTPLIHYHPFLRSLFIGSGSQTRNMLRMRQKYAPAAVRPPVPELGTGEGGTDPCPRPEELAFHLYRGALLDLVPIGERLTKLVAGLEQLYLNNSTSVDRKRAVSLRASSLLEGWGFDALKVARDIREGFRIKGDQYDANTLGLAHREETLQLCEDLAEYLRASLVIFYQTCSSLPRDELIDATDLLVQGKDLPENVAGVLERVFVNESVPQPYR